MSPTKVTLETWYLFTLSVCLINSVSIFARMSQFRKFALRDKSTEQEQDPACCCVRMQFMEECVCVCPLKVLQVYMLQKRERVCLCVCVPFQVLQVYMFMEESVCIRACVCWEALGTGPGCWLGSCAACILALREGCWAPSHRALVLGVSVG